MVYYVMAHHSELVLLLRERKYSSLKCLFEDVEEFKENICASKKIRDRVYFDNLHAQDEKQEECQYISYLQQKYSEYESDLEQQKGCKYVLNLEPDSSVCSDFSIDRDACHVYDQFLKHFEHEVTNYCIDNYMFLVEHYQYDLESTVQLSCDHYFEEEKLSPDDQALLIKCEEGYLLSSKEECMHGKLFYVDQ
jgi:hypothetical protein